MRFISSKRARKASLVCFTAATSLLGTAAHGATIYSWTAAGTGSWNDATQWTPATGSPVAGDTAIFNAVGADGTDLVYLNGSEAADTITVNNSSATTIVGGTAVTAAAQSLTLTTGLTVNSGAGAVTTGTSSGNNVLLQAGGNIAITNNSSSLLTIGGAVGSTALRGNGTAGTDIVTLGGSGNGLVAGVIQNNTTTIAITKNDSGIWEIDGSSSFTGNVILNDGQLNLKSSNALGTSTSKTFFINGGSLGSVSATRSLPAFNVVIGGDFSFGDSTTTTGTIMKGAVDLGNAIRTINTVGDGTFNGIVSGVGGGITKTGAGGNLGFGAQNTYTGATSINAGTIVASTSNAFSAASAVTIPSGGVMNMAGYSQEIASLSDGGGAGGNVYVGNGLAGMLTTGGDNSSTTFSGSIGGSTAPGNTGTGGGLTKKGSGQFTLTGSNGYGGPTAVSAGTLALGNASGNALANTVSVAMNGGAVLLNNSNQINDAATVTFGGGTFNTGGNSEAVGAATLTASSVIDMGSGSSVLAFANSSAATWTPSTNLDIYDWSGTPITGGGTDQLFFGTDATGLTPTQLAEIRFFSDAGTTQYAGATKILSDGEVLPGAVPEPASLSLLAIGGLALVRRRRAR